MTDTKQLQKQVTQAEKVRDGLREEHERAEAARAEAERVLEAASVANYDAAFEIAEERAKEARRSQGKLEAAKREVQDLKARLGEAVYEANMEAFQTERQGVETELKTLHEIGRAYMEQARKVRGMLPALVEKGRAAGITVAPDFARRVGAVTGGEVTALKELRAVPCLKVVFDGKPRPGDLPSYALKFAWMDRDGKVLAEQVPVEFLQQTQGLGEYAGLRPYVESTLTDNPTLEVSEPPRTKEYKP